MNIQETAEKYAEGKANQAITKAIADAYVEGYKAGYKDREEEIPMDLRDNKTEYVDLGLPSGTLWASDYEKSNDEYIYLPYEEAKHMNLPTVEQWKEVQICCKIIYRNEDVFDKEVIRATVIGPNGKSITFFTTGYIEDGKVSENKAFFWLYDEREDLNKKTVQIYSSYCSGNLTNGSPIHSHLAGYKLPIRLVR